MTTIQEYQDLINGYDEKIKDYQESISRAKAEKQSLISSLDMIIVDGLSYKTRRLLKENDRVHLKMGYNYKRQTKQAVLEQYDGVEPCGASQWEFLTYLQDYELDYILKNWQKLKISVHKYEDALRGDIQ